MNGPEALLNSAGCMATRMGQAFVGRRAVFRGQDLHAELRHLDWMALYVLGITGRHHSEAQIRLLHALWVCTSYPDARIWNNRTAALAGSARSTPGLGIAAALAMSEATIYGGHPYVSSIDFFIRARAHEEQGGALSEFVDAELARGRIYGYGRPIAAIDERLPWVLGIARELQLDGGPHLRIALEVDNRLVARNPKLSMNYAAMMSALCADLGFSATEMHHFQVPVFMAGMSPCFIEAAERAPGTVFPLSCDHIAYEGPARRHWPADESQP
jgi:citrate synthase